MGIFLSSQLASFLHYHYSLLILRSGS
ncbi:hypothetical protein VCHENC02_4255A, partial [Vibrio harveyi]